MGEITMDGEEMRLLVLYERTFGETPPVAHLDPETSKRLIKQALKSKSPVNEKDFASNYE